MWLLGVIIAILLVAFHRQLAIVLHSGADLLHGLASLCEDVLAKAWNASWRWLKSESWPSLTPALVGCLVFGLAIFAALNNLSILQELIPQVFPFGSGGNTLAVTLAVSACFVGMLLHQIQHRLARFGLGMLAVALIGLVSFLAYSGASALDSVRGLQRGGVPEEWPFNRDIAAATSLALFYSTAELIGFWGALHLAGAVICGIGVAPLLVVIRLGLLIAQWLNRDSFQKSVHWIIAALDGILGRLAAAAVRVTHFCWQHCQPEAIHARILARLSHKQERNQRHHEEVRQRCELQRSRKASEAEANHQADLKALERKMIRKAVAQTGRAFNVALAESFKHQASNQAQVVAGSKSGSSAQGALAAANHHPLRQPGIETYQASHAPLPARGGNHVE